MNADCPHCENVNALLAGELPPTEQAEMTTHLAVCPLCRAEWESSRAVLDLLHQLPAVESSRDLAPLVLSRIRPAPPARWRSVARTLAAAAAVILLMGLCWLLIQRSETAGDSVANTTLPPTESATVARALDWFVSQQAADGSWDAERWGGQQKFSPALTALPLLALVTTGEPTPARQRAAAHAAMHLMELQNADGSFGPRFFGQAYNSSLSTLALLHTWQRLPELVEKAALDAAVAALIRSQTDDGGWGTTSNSPSDLSITQWHLQALETAARLGWSAAAAAASRAQVSLAALSAVHSADSPDSPPAVTAAPLNFYAAYFAAHALKDDSSAQASQQLSHLRQQLQLLQATEGEEMGSWAPDEQWGRAGGRLYATALAALALNAQLEERSTQSGEPQ